MSPGGAGTDDPGRSGPNSVTTPARNPGKIKVEDYHLTAEEITDLGGPRTPPDNGAGSNGSHLARGLRPGTGFYRRQHSKGRPMDKGFAKRVREKYRRYKADPELLHNRDLHRRILSAWKQESPVFWKELVTSGLAQEAAFVAQQEMWEERDRLVAAGMAVTDAREQAERVHLLLGSDLPEPSDGERSRAEKEEGELRRLGR